MSCSSSRWHWVVLSRMPQRPPHRGCSPSAGQDAMTDAPRVVRSNERGSATGLPIGVAGEQAFHDDSAWVGFLDLTPGASSPWHHHGEWVSYAYVMRGVLRWEFGEKGSEAI